MSKRGPVVNIVPHQIQYLSMKEVWVLVLGFLVFLLAVLSD